MATLLFRNIFSIQVLMVLYFSSLAAGFNATLSLSDDQPVGWQAGGDRRGTWAIVSSCLSTIFACTWTIQHLNVPGKPTLDGKWARKFRSCKWMVVNVLFPEFIVLQAAFELFMAIQALRLMEKMRKTSLIPGGINLSDPHRSLSNSFQPYSDAFVKCSPIPTAMIAEISRTRNQQNPLKRKNTLSGPSHIASLQTWVAFTTNMGNRDSP